MWPKLTNAVKSSVIPFGLWSDATPMNWDRSESLELSILPGLPKDSGSTSWRFPIAAISHKNVAEGVTLNEIFEVLLWSFQQLFVGKMRCQRLDSKANPSLLLSVASYRVSFLQTSMVLLNGRANAWILRRRIDKFQYPFIACFAVWHWYTHRKGLQNILFPRVCRLELAAVFMLSIVLASPLGFLCRKFWVAFWRSSMMIFLSWRLGPVVTLWTSWFLGFLHCWGGLMPLQERRVCHMRLHSMFWEPL